MLDHLNNDVAEVEAVTAQMMYGMEWEKDGEIPTTTKGPSMRVAGRCIVRKSNKDLLSVEGHVEGRGESSSFIIITVTFWHISLILSVLSCGISLTTHWTGEPCYFYP